MENLFFEKPILNSPYEYPLRHWETDSRRCHINWVILDSDWEAEFCRVAEAHPKVKAYVKNHNLGLEVPYRYASEMRTYLPDFIVQVDDGRGDKDLLQSDCGNQRLST